MEQSEVIPLIACEIKSSIDKAGMYRFGRKVDFYAKRNGK